MKLTRRQFAAGAGLAAAATGLGVYPLLKTRIQKPNIVVFLADDLRFDTLGYLGHPIVKTPNLDALAPRSFIFKNNFVTTSVCSVSRASLLSGMYFYEHQVRYGTSVMPAKYFNASYPLVLRQAGYYTGFIGKWGFGGHPWQSFDKWHGFQGQGHYFEKNNPKLHLTDRQTQHALDFIKNAPSDRPFLLVVAYKAPHFPFKPQERFKDWYRGTAIPRAATDIAEAFAALPPMFKQSRGEKDYAAFSLKDDAIYQETVRNYYRLVSGWDDSIGKIIAQLENGGHNENTALVATSDNGFMFGEHGLMGKWCMFEESIRTPMLMQLPPRFFLHYEPKTIEAFSLNIDVCPTIISMAGLSPAPAMQGKNLLSLMENPETSWREGFYYEHPFILPGNMLGAHGWRGREWKYTRYQGARQQSEVLFNLSQDPSELTNLAGNERYSDVLMELRQRTAQKA